MCCFYRAPVGPRDPLVGNLIQVRRTDEGGRDAHRYLPGSAVAPSAGAIEAHRPMASRWTISLGSDLAA
jgi:hypothetical protein